MKRIQLAFQLCVLILSITVLAGNTTLAQNKKKFKSPSRSYNKWKYRGTVTKKPDKVCHEANKKRVKGPKKKTPHISSGKKKYAEGAPSGFNPYNNDPKSSSRTVQVKKTDTQPAKSLSEMTLDEKHSIEDDVLKRNNLPEPTSEKHEQIRKNVEQHLANFENETPLKLEPLYFVINQDEFAFVDMDPFLIAVEYALQGKHVLIEGHTDSSGQSDYNVQLSIKRVERIRQLMIDMGVSDDQISVVGYGEEHSETGDETEKDPQLDRRVDFTAF